MLLSSKQKSQNAPIKFSEAVFLHSSLLSIILLCKFQLFYSTWIQISTLQFSESTVVYLSSSILCQRSKFISRYGAGVIDCRAHFICFPSLVIIALHCPLSWFPKRHCFQCLLFSFLVVCIWRASSGLVIHWQKRKYCNFF